MKPRISAEIMASGKVLVERRPRDLKVGYLTVLTIMAERNSSTTASRYPHLPRLLLLFVELDDQQGQRGHQPGRRRNGETEKFLAAAAAGLGGQAVEARQAEGAADQVNGGDEPAPLVVRLRIRPCSTTRWTRNAGAAPNEIRSASESNSRPKGLSTPPMRATRPSNKSKMQASRMKPRAT